MKVTPTAIEGLLIIEPRIFHDSRGYFFESYSKKVLDPLIGKIEFVQDNQSCSTRGVIRGLHFQKPPFSQAKLVRCVKGHVLDVAVDLRENSKTYGQYVAVELTDVNHLQLFIPKGFAHGFEVLSEVAVFQYKCDEYYNPEAEAGIDPFDETLNINWHSDARDAIVSDKDKTHPKFSDFLTPFTR